MKKILILSCAILMLSFSAPAEDTVETCAGGAGTIFTGKVTGHKYCKSNKAMSWWDAHAWCDALGKRLFSMDDCECSSVIDCVKKCPELNNVLPAGRGWTMTPLGTDKAYYIALNSGGVSNYERTGYTFSGFNSAVCK